MVVLSHSFTLTGAREPLEELTGGVTFGRLGIAVFFLISGYLITASWERDRKLWHYTAKRALRLFPALVVVALLTAIVLGPLVTEDSTGEYFGDLSVYIYFIKSSLLLTYDQFYREYSKTTHMALLLTVLFGLFLLKLLLIFV